MRQPCSFTRFSITRFSISALISALIPVLAVAVLVTPAWAGNRLAVFPFELIDSSLEGQRADQQARLILLDDQLQAMLRDDGRYELIAPEAIRRQLDQYDQPMHNCNLCPARIATATRADLAMTLWVQKVSNLILNVNMALIEPHSRRVFYRMSVDIRGKTDISWQRGLRSLVRNRLLGREADAIQRALRRVRTQAGKTSR